VWIEPEVQGEFDVAVGAVVKSADGTNICLVDDDKRVCSAFSKLIDVWRCIVKQCNLSRLIDCKL
jgi:hypothetical protein